MRSRYSFCALPTSGLASRRGQRPQALGGVVGEAHDEAVELLVELLLVEVLVELLALHGTWRPHPDGALSENHGARDHAGDRVE